MEGSSANTGGVTQNTGVAAGGDQGRVNSAADEVEAEQQNQQEDGLDIRD